MSRIFDRILSEGRRIRTLSEKRRIRILSEIRRTPVLAGVAVALVVAGAVTLVVALSSQHHAPRPTRQAAAAPLGPISAAPSSVSSASTLGPSRPHPVKPAGPAASLAPGNGQLVLSSSTPMRLSIPALGVSSTLLELGLNPDGTAQVPPLNDVSQAGWYRFSPTPGAAGSAVMLGHIDSATYGSGVFYRLGALTPGDEVDVTRADGTTAVFRVDRVAEYPKSSFPTQLVYGPTNYPSLRLVTCGGAYDSQAHSYLDNIVAYTSLVAQRRR
ncbi:MAG: class F sortase [Actinomycetota bacterium]|nr:class F sortase [Actinomycetota bacterium]